MSNYYSAVTSKHFKAEFPKDEQKVNIFESRYLIMYNAYQDALRENDDNKYVRAFKRTKERFIAKIVKPEYFINHTKEELKEVSPVIYKVPEGFDGIFNETQLEEFEVIGTLITLFDKKYIETDLEKVEMLRRERMGQAIENGRVKKYKGRTNELFKTKDEYLTYLSNNKNESFLRNYHGFENF